MISVVSHNVLSIDFYTKRLNLVKSVELVLTGFCWRARSLQRHWDQIGQRKTLSMWMAHVNCTHCIGSIDYLQFPMKACLSTRCASVPSLACQRFMKQTLTCKDAKVGDSKRPSFNKEKRQLKKNMAKHGVDVGAMPREMTPAARTWNPGQVRFSELVMLHGSV